MNYLSVREAAEICGLSDNSIRLAIDAGRLKSIRLGNRGKHRITIESLAESLGLPVDEVKSMADEVKTIWG